MLSTGIESLDKLLPNIMAFNTLLVIAGHPGSGKTTLATSICYNNALNNNRCLYISFQETRDKLYRVAKNLGLDLEMVESANRFRFLKIPLISSEDMAIEIIDLINKAIYDFKPVMVVIDSITPLLKVLESDVKARSMLQNYFYELPNQINGVVILLAEIPLNMDRIELGDIEFVADSVIILRHKIENNLLVRELEIRKARGSPVTIARAPFTIAKDIGIKIYTPIVLEDVPGIKWDKIFKQPCQIFQNVIGSYYGGEIIYIEYPYYSKPLRIFLYGSALIATNNARAIIFSYKASPKQLIGLFQFLAKRYGADIDFNEYFNMAINLDKTRFIALNPSAYSIEELYHIEITEIEKFKPDIAIFLDVETIKFKDTVYSNLLRNQLLFLKKMGILTIRFGLSLGDSDYTSFALADSIVREVPYRDGKSIKRDFYVYRMGREPVVISHEEADECVKECIEVLKKII
jgi:circadian clock protein KaiC